MPKSLGIHSGENNKKYTSQKRITLDEKIECMVKWRKEHPDLTFVPRVDRHFLRTLTESEHEFEKLHRQYHAVLSYYIYAISRLNDGKMTQEQIKKCKEGNVGGVFGLSTELESEEKKLMEKYGLDGISLNWIIRNYRSIDRFRRIHKESILRRDIHSSDSASQIVINNINLVGDLDISSPDWVWRTGKYEKLAKNMIDTYIALSDQKFYFINYDGLEEKIIDIIDNGNFTDNERRVIHLLCLDENGKTRTQKEVANQMGISQERVRQLLERTIKRLREPNYFKELDFENRVLFMDYDLWSEIVKEYFKNNDIFVSKEPIDMNPEFKEQLNQMLFDGLRKTKQRDEYADIMEKMPEEQVNDILKETLGNNSHNRGIHESRHSLYRKSVVSEYAEGKVLEFIVEKLDKSGYTTEKKDEIVECIRNCNYFDEDRKKQLIDSLNEKIQDDKKAKIIKEIDEWVLEKKTFAIDELDVGIRIYNALMRARYTTTDDLIGKTEDEIMQIPNLGKKSCEELLELLKLRGIGMVDGKLGHISMISDEETMRIINEKIDAIVDKPEDREELKQLLHEKYAEKSTEKEDDKAETAVSSSIPEPTSISTKKYADELKDINSEMGIEILELSVRSMNCLKQAGFSDLISLIGKRPQDLLKIRNMGHHSYAEVVKKLETFGIVMQEGMLLYDDSHNQHKESRR